jgi:hypothetical protein
MKFNLTTQIPPSGFDIKHGNGIVLLGSCFANNMVQHFERSGFEVMSNPFGTLFHPVAISQALVASMHEQHCVAVVQRDDLYFAWSASGSVYGSSTSEVEEKVLEARKALRERLQQSKLLVVTFGTSWGYALPEHGLVANCHKKPADLFEKSLWSVDDMYEAWKNALQLVKELNPDLKIVFSVSPVRHKKDGLVENNRSKSRLIELVHRLVESDGVGELSYFPAYELVIDELRDHRFFKSDLVHPTDEAVSYVWECFSSYLFASDTVELIKKVNQVNRTLEHKSLYPGTQSDVQRLEKAREAQGSLSKKHPEIYWK